MLGVLAGQRILVVEDDPIIALDLAQTLCNAGAVVIGPALMVASALQMVEDSLPDLAVLDWRLETETTAPVARRLAELGVPFLFHTSSRGDPETFHPGILIIDKPTRPEQLVHALQALTCARRKAL